MFPAGRFVSETPNVIDPGEMPPSRPTRVENNDKRNLEYTPSNGNSNGTANGTSTEPDAIFKTPISRGIRVQLALDADEEPDDMVSIDDDFDEDDPEYGSPSSLSDASPPRISISSDQPPSRRP